MLFKVLSTAVRHGSGTYEREWQEDDEPVNSKVTDCHGHLASIRSMAVLNERTDRSPFRGQMRTAGENECEEEGNGPEPNQHQEANG